MTYLGPTAWLPVLRRIRGSGTRTTVRPSVVQRATIVAQPPDKSSQAFLLAGGGTFPADIAICQAVETQDGGQ